jgi:hypothetical protein
MNRIVFTFVLASLAHPALAEPLGEHPAVIVARTWSSRAIDPNTFIVLPPASAQFLAVSPNEKDKAAGRQTQPQDASPRSPSQENTRG